MTVLTTTEIEADKNAREAREARETGISQVEYLENNPRWLQYAKYWKLRTNRMTPEAGQAFEAGLALGYEAGVRPFLKADLVSEDSEIR